MLREQPEAQMRAGDERDGNLIGDGFQMGRMDLQWMSLCQINASFCASQSASKSASESASKRVVGEYLRSTGGVILSYAECLTT
jgi:hypothetical protein